MHNHTLIVIFKPLGLHVKEDFADSVRSGALLFFGKFGRGFESLFSFDSFLSWFVRFETSVFFLLILGDNFAPPLILVIGDGTRLLFIESRAPDDADTRFKDGELLLERLFLVAVP